MRAKKEAERASMESPMAGMRLVLFVSIAAACGPSGRGHGDDTNAADAKEPDAYCPTSITGKVYAPISDPPPFPSGVQCSRCESSLPGGAFASTTTDATGSFHLEGIPAGA